MDLEHIAEAVKRYHLEDVRFLGRRTQEQNAEVDVVVPERVLLVISRLLSLGVDDRSHGFEYIQDARALLKGALEDLSR